MSTARKIHHFSPLQLPHSKKQKKDAIYCVPTNKLLFIPLGNTTNVLPTVVLVELA